ncbi:MAG: NIL domain-containing protein [Gomphosphaeria aponina SAG 52.96 = DSM 107014]|uniref:NIL domain-containing protein n=1 Tax=Gomphosphaeria aponina SAG 52.96 = DSM 107014 TaxID=1521640 RepID=A0A941GP56_9CHRO|nr:NIL domain-containing protein [Gomphosphaeria aponina SAG 52.96 = DSM 107014]
MVQVYQAQAQQPTTTKIRIKIPKKYSQQPVIQQLAADHNVKINILAALLFSHGDLDGWFDLELRGNSQKIKSALRHLEQLGVEVWKL